MSSVSVMSILILVPMFGGMRGHVSKMALLKLTVIDSFSSLVSGLFWFIIMDTFLLVISCSCELDECGKVPLVVKSMVDPVVLFVMLVELGVVMWFNNFVSMSKFGSKL